MLIGNERPIPDGRVMVGVQAQPRCRGGGAVHVPSGACSPLRTAPVTHTCTTCSFSHTASATTPAVLTGHWPDSPSAGQASFEALGPGPAAASRCIWNLAGAGCCARVSSAASSTHALSTTSTSSCPAPPVQACHHSHAAGFVPKPCRCRKPNWKCSHSST